MSIKNKKLKYDLICAKCGRKLARANHTHIPRWQDQRDGGPYICNYDAGNASIIWHEPMDPLLHAAQKAVDQ